MGGFVWHVLALLGFYRRNSSYFSIMFYGFFKVVENIISVYHAKTSTDISVLGAPKESMASNSSVNPSFGNISYASIIPKEGFAGRSLTYRFPLGQKF